MQLAQKRFLIGPQVLRLNEDEVQVVTADASGRREYSVALSQLNPQTARFTYRAISWQIAGAIFVLLWLGISVALTINLWSSPGDLIAALLVSSCLQRPHADDPQGVSPAHDRLRVAKRRRRRVQCLARSRRARNRSSLSPLERASKDHLVRCQSCRLCRGAVSNRRTAQAQRPDRDGVCRGQGADSRGDRSPAVDSTRPR